MKGSITTDTELIDVNYTPEQAITAQMVNRGIALLFL
jgi:hypothetical protein